MKFKNKSLDSHFRSWEFTAFGYGYGTGEPPIIEALKIFMDFFMEKIFNTITMSSKSKLENFRHGC
jgi:hypothetical protein